MWNIRAIIWDLDNTITNSKEAHFFAWDETLKSYNIPHSREFFERHYGMSNREIFEMYLSDYVQSQDIDKVSEEKEARFREIIKERPVEILPGVLDWMKYFKDAGLTQGVASSAPMINIIAQIQSISLGDYLHVVVTGAPLKYGKPHPQVFLNTASGLGAKSDQCLVIEDTLHGIEAALRGNMHCILVRNNDARDEASIASLVENHATRREQYICLGSLSDMRPDSVLTHYN